MQFKIPTVFISISDWLKPSLTEEVFSDENILCNVTEWRPALRHPHRRTGANLCFHLFPASDLHSEVGMHFHVSYDYICAQEEHFQIVVQKNKMFIGCSFEYIFLNIKSCSQFEWFLKFEYDPNTLNFILFCQHLLQIDMKFEGVHKSKQKIMSLPEPSFFPTLLKKLTLLTLWYDQMLQSVSATQHFKYIIHSKTN